MSIQNIFNSHNIWFDLLSYTKLNELFQRASRDPVNNTILLQQHINRLLPNNSKYYIRINLEEQYTLPNKKKDICSNILIYLIKKRKSK